MAEPDFATEFFEHSFEPRAVAAGLQTDDHSAAELCIKHSHLVFVLVLEFVGDDLSTFSCQITDRLLSCMKVNADIYCFHSASFQSHVESTGREFTTRGRRRLLHNIKL